MNQRSWSGVATDFCRLANFDRFLVGGTLTSLDDRGGRRRTIFRLDHHMAFLWFFVADDEVGRRISTQVQMMATDG